MNKFNAIEVLIPHVAKRAIRAIREGRKTKADLYKLYDINTVGTKMSLVEYTKLIDEFYAKVKDTNNSEEMLINDVKALWKLYR